MRGSLISQGFRELMQAQHTGAESNEVNGSGMRIPSTEQHRHSLRLSSLGCTKAQETFSPCLSCPVCKMGLKWG